MAIWKFPENFVYDLTSFDELTEVFIKLPANQEIDSNGNKVDPVFILEEGQLPGGLIVDQFSIVGTLSEINRSTTYEFKIRATSSINNSYYEIRSFKLTVNVKIWNSQGPFNLGTISERVRAEINLPLNTNKDTSQVVFSVIAGKLPPGLFIENQKITGTPFEVIRDSNFKFVIRASYQGGVSDRAFEVLVTGPDAPQWITQPGLLPVGPSENFYILDTSYVDFSLFAIDNDTAAGQELHYTILDSSGELPPGLILMPNGRIVGIIQPLLAIPIELDNGNYDTSGFDFIAYDLGFRSSNGYDRFVYDFATFDTFTKSRLPTKINRNYEFRVTVTDGDLIAERVFKIYVVGEDHFRADSEITYIGESTFTADSSHVKQPIWVTPNYLGYKRADNYHIFKLDIYEDPDETGPVVYTLNGVNKEIFGYSFTTSITENKIGTNTIRLTDVNKPPRIGYKLQLNRNLEGGIVRIYNIAGVERVSNTEYILTLGGSGGGIFQPTPLETDIPNGELIYFGSESLLPPGMQFDTGTGEVFGYVPYSPAVVRNYSFTVTATRLSDTGELNYSDRTFTVDIAGEIESSISWITPSDLGSIDADIISNLYVKAVTNIPNSTLIYTLINGSLPFGLSLNISGEIVGKVNQFKLNYHSSGITTFEDGFTLDDNNTTIDKSFTFTVRAKDPLGLVEDTKTFTLFVNTPNDRLFSNLIVRPFLKPIQRANFKDFMNDPDIFENQYIYRPEDPNFGLQKDLTMLVYAGIETKESIEYINAVSKNHKIKRFKLGDLKTAVARNLGSNDIVYEVIYIDVIDPLEKNGNHLPNRIVTRGSTELITVDQSGQFYPKYINYTYEFLDSPDTDTDIEELDIAQLPEIGEPDTIYLIKSINSITGEESINKYDWIGVGTSGYYQPHSARTVFWSRPNPIFATIDNSNIIANDPGTSLRYPSSISLWRQRIKSIENSKSDRMYLPLWMRSIQPGNVEELDFVPAIPICYCKPGTSNRILTNIKNSGFDFRQIDYTIDRYIINRVKDYNYNKYIVFENTRTNI
jgi:hypothetical protein